MFLENPPFNKFAICFEEPFLPSAAVLLASDDGINFSQLHRAGDLRDRLEYVKIFEKRVTQSYVRLVLEEPQAVKGNLCRQIKLRGIEFSNITFMQTRFAGSLSMRLTHHPILFRLLEMLEYKALLLRARGDKNHEIFEGRLN